MGFRVKKCANCNTINDINEVQCSACACMLPSQIITHDFPPPAPPKPIPPTTEAKTKHFDQRDWRYGDVPVVIQHGEPLQVTITGLDIGFVDLMWLMIQLLLAAIPAIITATVIIVVVVAAFGGALSGLIR